MSRHVYPHTHPIWKVAQQALTLAALIFIVYHLGLGGHESGGIDASDGVGGMLIVKELIYWIRQGAKDGTVKE